MSEDLVTIIVPVYNCADYLRICIDSILKQSYKNIEVILINDGSKDNSLEICDYYKKKDKRIKVISNDNHGVSYSRNTGLKVASGEYICFVDSDDWISDEYIFKLISNLQKHKSDIAVCNYFSSLNGKLFRENDLVGIGNLSYMEFILRNNCWAPWGKIFRKKVLTEYFDENVSCSEDMLFNFMNSKNIITFSCINEPLYYYRKKDDNKFRIEKVSKKHTSELDALLYIIENSEGYVKNFVTCHYISTLHRLIYYDKKNNPQTFLDKKKYIKTSKKIGKNLLFKRNLRFKKKAKNILMLYFSQIYYIILDIKIKLIKYK